MAVLGHQIALLALAALPVLAVWPLCQRLGVARPVPLAGAIVILFAGLNIVIAFDSKLAIFAVTMLTPLSFGTVTFAALMVYARIAADGSFIRRESVFFSVICLLLGTPLFLSVTGYLPTVDIYAAGYGPFFLPAVMTAILIVGVVAKSWVCVLWPGLAAGAWLTGLHPSRNLWDILVDPVGWTIAAVLAGYFLGCAAVLRFRAA